VVEMSTMPLRATGTRLRHAIDDVNDATGDRRRVDHDESGNHGSE
jgi:hypothetical protein